MPCWRGWQRSRRAVNPATGNGTTSTTDVRRSAHQRGRLRRQCSAGWTLTPFWSPMGPPGGAPWTFAWRRGGCPFAAHGGSTARFQLAWRARGEPTHRAAGFASDAAAGRMKPTSPAAVRLEAAHLRPAIEGSCSSPPCRRSRRRSSDGGCHSAGRQVAVHRGRCRPSLLPHRRTPHPSPGV
jgi:hypothetical protein